MKDLVTWLRKPRTGGEPVGVVNNEQDMREQIPEPVTGQIVLVNDLSQVMVYDGSQWVASGPAIGSWDEPEPLPEGEFDWSEVFAAAARCKEEHDGKIPQGWILALPWVNDGILEMAEDLFPQVDVVKSPRITKPVFLPEWNAPAETSDELDPEHLTAEQIASMDMTTYAKHREALLAKVRDRSRIFVVAGTYQQARQFAAEKQLGMFVEFRLVQEERDLRGVQWQDGDALAMVGTWWDRDDLRDVMHSLRMIGCPDHLLSNQPIVVQPSQQGEMRKFVNRNSNYDYGYQYWPEERLTMEQMRQAHAYVVRTTNSTKPLKES